jgi:endonuclease III
MVMEVSRMTEDAIRERLIEHGKALFAKPRAVVEFTKLAPANLLLNDLDGHPHAFVLTCVMDRQIKAERAWLIPHRISEKLGGFSMDALVQLSQKEVFRLMSKPVPLHRFSDTMSRFFHAAVQRIAEEYAGDASGIWANRPSSAEVVCRFLQFDGVGPKIATMAANILARDYKVPFSDYYSIDISADVHVRRVFGRLGLCSSDATVEQLVYKARALHPEFPGIVDLPIWEIGRLWCRPHDPACSACYMQDLCPSVPRPK